MITAMQELIERLDKTEKQLDKENNLIMSSALYSAKNMALELLKKEKEQIIDAYNHNMTGFDKLEQEEIGLNWAEDYYNKTYNQNNS
jgi:vacuolar-type H+-ATPase subunit E/Vma4